MGEMALLAEPSKAYLATMLWIVVLLFWPHKDQSKSGFPWMGVIGESTYSHWIPTNERVPKTCLGGFIDTTMGLVVQGMGS